MTLKTNISNCKVCNQSVFSQVLTKEYYSLQTSLDKRVVELEASLSDKSARLSTYEKLEEDLDTVVMQAAEGHTRRNRDFRINIHKFLEVLLT